MLRSKDPDTKRFKRTFFPPPPFFFNANSLSVVDFCSRSKDCLTFRLVFKLKALNTFQHLCVALNVHPAISHGKSNQNTCDFTYSFRDYIITVIAFSLALHTRSFSLFKQFKTLQAAYFSGPLKGSTAMDTSPRVCVCVCVCDSFFCYHYL